MRAVLCKAFGEPETLVVEETADPEPGEGELRVAVAAAGVNFADLLMVAGKYQEKPEFRHVGQPAAGRTSPTRKPAWLISGATM